MKHFLTKVFSVVLCGALLFTACHKEIKQDIETLKADTSELWAQFKSLKSSLETTYATKVELQAVESTVNTVKTSVTNLETLVATKADKTALEAAVKEVKDAMKNFITADALKDYVKTSALTEQLTKLTTDLQTYASTEIKKLEDKIAAIETCDCDLTEIESAIDALETALDTAETEIEAAMEELEGALDELEAAIDEINSDEFLADLYDYVDEGDDELLEKIELANEAIAKAAADAKLALQMAGSGSSCTCPDWTSTINGLKSSIKTLEEKLAGLEGGTTGLDEEAVEAIIAAYLDKVDGVNDAIDALNLKVSEREIVSIKLVPSVLVNGSPAAKFGTLTYEGGVLSTATTLTYLVNPSTADLTDTEFGIVSHEAEIITKASASLDIEFGDGEIYLTLERGDIDGNVFALAATTNGATVYSDYAQVYEVQADAADLVWANPAEVTIATDAEYDVAENVYVEDFDEDLFGLEYVYELGDDEFDGVIEELEEGEYTVTVSLVDADGVVVTSTELDVIAVDGLTSATVTGVAMRVAFEVNDVISWITELKDLPNTKETIMNAAAALAQGDYMTAYELLGGVPGFVKQYKEFTGTGTADSMLTPLLAPKMQRASYDIPDEFEAILDLIPAETLEEIKTIVKESGVDIDELIEKVEGIEDLQDIFDIMAEEDYKDIIDEALGVLQEDGIELDDMLGEIEGSIVDMIPDEIFDFVEKVENKLQSIVDSLGDSLLEPYIKKFINNIISEINIENAEAIVDLLMSQLDIDDLASLFEMLPVLEDKIEELKPQLKSMIEKIEDALAGLEELPEIGLPEIELPEIDFDAIIEKIENIDINDIITPERIEEFKAELKPILEKILAYLESNFPGADDDSDEDIDEPQDPIVPPTEDEDYDDLTEAQRLAIEAAINDFWTNVDAENEKILAALPNGNWGKLVAALDHPVVSGILAFVPDFKAALEALISQVTELALYNFDGDFEVVVDGEEVEVEFE